MLQGCKILNCIPPPLELPALSTTGGMNQYWGRRSQGRSSISRSKSTTRGRGGGGTALRNATYAGAGGLQVVSGVHSPPADVALADKRAAYNQFPMRSLLCKPLEEDGRSGGHHYESVAGARLRK
jgi:hypothetical protein